MEKVFYEYRPWFFLALAGYGLYISSTQNLPKFAVFSSLVLATLSVLIIMRRQKTREKVQLRSRKRPSRRSN